MNEYLIYLLQVSICLAVLYSIFYLLLRKLTFHKANRAILLLILPFSIAIPLLSGFAQTGFALSQIDVPNFTELTLEQMPLLDTQLGLGEVSPLNIWFYFAIIYWFGFAVSMFRLLLSVFNLYKLKRKSTVQVKNGYSFIVADVPTIFSCFSWIFIPKNKLNSYQKPVLEHEKAHSRLGHTFDLLLTEIYIAVCWFNPFVYLFRKSIKSIHEFQADAVVLQEQVKKSFYLKLLLEEIKMTHQLKLHSYFNYPILKNRIDMLSKTNSKKWNSLKYFILLPILAMLSMSFSELTKELPQNMQNPTTHIFGIPEDTPSIFPLKTSLKNKITAPFGKRFRHPISKKDIVHGGIDIRASLGTAVFATADGTISKAKSEGNWGNLIVISHGENYQTWYAHLQGFNCKASQKVKKGDIIGYVGSTGQSTGSHLHYEVRLKGKGVNPMDYYSK